jgi:hypothetical protein
VFFSLTQRVWPARCQEERAGHGAADPWCEAFRSLGAALGMRVSEPVGGE